MSNVDDSVQDQIRAARRKREKRRQQRAEFAEAREYGLEARKRTKMRHWDDDPNTAA